MAEPPLFLYYCLSWFYSGSGPTVLCPTHPADQSDLGGSRLCSRHLAQPILGLGDVKLRCQLLHAAGCQRGGLSINVRTAWLRRTEMRWWAFLPPESASLSLLVNPSYANIALWTHGNEDRSDDMTDTCTFTPTSGPLMCSVLITVNIAIASPFTSSCSLSMASSVHHAYVKRRICPLLQLFSPEKRVFLTAAFGQVASENMPHRTLQSAKLPHAAATPQPICRFWRPPTEIFTTEELTGGKTTCQSTIGLENFKSKVESCKCIVSVRVRACICRRLILTGVSITSGAR